MHTFGLAQVAHHVEMSADYGVLKEVEASSGMSPAHGSIAEGQAFDHHLFELWQGFSSLN